MRTTEFIENEISIENQLNQIEPKENKFKKKLKYFTRYITKKFEFIKMIIIFMFNLFISVTSVFLMINLGDSKFVSIGITIMLIDSIVFLLYPFVKFLSIYILWYIFFFFGSVFRIYFFLRFIFLGNYVTFFYKNYISQEIYKIITIEFFVFNVICVTFHHIFIIISNYLCFSLESILNNQIISCVKMINLIFLILIMIFHIIYNSLDNYHLILGIVLYSFVIFLQYFYLIGSKNCRRLIESFFVLSSSLYFTINYGIYICTTCDYNNNYGEFANNTMFLLVNNTIYGDCQNTIQEFSIGLIEKYKTYFLNLIGINSALNI